MLDLAGLRHLAQYPSHVMRSALARHLSDVCQLRKAARLSGSKAHEIDDFADQEALQYVRADGDKPLLYSSCSRHLTHLTGDDNLVSGAKVSGNGGDGIFLRNRQNQITSSQSTGNGGAGGNVACSGTITNFTAKSNSGGSLTLVDTGNGDCTQLNNKL